MYVLLLEAERVERDPDFEYYFKGINFDVFLSYSDNQGNTWSEPIKVNDDIGEGDQYFPSIDIDGNSIVNIAFFDHRDNQDLAQFDVYYAFSQDGGQTFSRNLKVNQRPIPNPLGGRAWGDYFDLVHGKTRNGISYVGYPCIDDSYTGEDPFDYYGAVEAYVHGRICIDRIYTGAGVGEPPPPLEPTLVISPPSAAINVGETFQFRGLYDSDGPDGPLAEQDTTFDSQTYWRTENANIAEVSLGNVRGITPGTVLIRAQYDGIQATAQVQVVGTAGRAVGLRAFDGANIINIAAEPLDSVVSPLRIRINDTTYGIILVEPSAPDASRIIINTPSGKKALKKL